jgi:alcohol dehydrogenase
MKALVYHGPGNKAWEEKPKPIVTHPADAIVKISKTTICGTDLHIMKGDVATVTDGRILGHEGVGIVEEVGLSVGFFKKGDHVLISCITSCGKCEFCKRGMYLVKKAWIQLWKPSVFRQHLNYVSVLLLLVAVLRTLECMAKV